MNLSELKDKWDQLAQTYEFFDSSMNIFFYQHIHMLRLKEATIIYQVGCGTAKLLAYTMNLKPKSTPYLAIDLSETMVALAKRTVRQFLSSLPV